jgi:hypothetical protein
MPLSGIKPQKSIFKDPKLSKCMCVPQGRILISKFQAGFEIVLICGQCLKDGVENQAKTAIGS